MKFENFNAGTWQQQYQYKSFQPIPVNQEWTWEEPTINLLLEQATKALGELNAFSLIVPDVDLFIQMHILKEANQSSKIEGTQTEMDEALMPEEQIKPEKRDDWRENKNYIQAINTAIDELTRLPLSNRLLRETHGILLQGVRGAHKQPGEFRTSQNWIGGSSLSDATFIPAHHDTVQELMSDLEKFWHNDQITVPHLVRIAISHYQFETIHPFLDGNGRIGRLLITLYLVSMGLLSKPSLYLSDFFEKNRASYYDALMRVRTSNDIIHWIKFFLNGVAKTATKGRDTFGQILIVRNEVEREILSLNRLAPSAHEFLKFLYRKPVFTTLEAANATGLTRPTINKLVTKFNELKILREITGYERNRVFVFDRYFKLFLI
ncbi:MAG: cell filamentation protein Fic [Deltaproteobacteria bacterium CG11_big_fil_rev_8_21_14_0_20_49_13]|nr:MAG: cell filamentation protein Fic [Deltaproteobacteria bacterium CG11_big_fil_rev_8_21_14_0_20_49_13]